MLEIESTVNIQAFMAVLVLLRSISNIYSTRLTRAVYVQAIGLLAPFLVALLSRVWLRDALPRYTWLSLTVTLIGTLMLLAGEIRSASLSFRHQFGNNLSL